MAGGEHHEVRTYTLLRNVCGGGVAPAPYKELAPLDPQSWGRCPQTPTLAVWQRAQYLLYCTLAGECVASHSQVTGSIFSAAGATQKKSPPLNT